MRISAAIVKNMLFSNVLLLPNSKTNGYCSYHGHIVLAFSLFICDKYFFFYYSGFRRNYDAETNTSDVKKIKNRRKQNLEDEANNMQLDKANRYLSVTVVLLLCSISLLVKYNLILRYEAGE